MDIEIYDNFKSFKLQFVAQINNQQLITDLHPFRQQTNTYKITYLIVPVNFSRTDLGPTHIISVEAILAITFVTYHKRKDKNLGHSNLNSVQKKFL